MSQSSPVPPLAGGSDTAARSQVAATAVEKIFSTKESGAAEPPSTRLAAHHEFLTLVEAPTVASPGTGSVTGQTDNAADRHRFAGLIEMDRAEIVSAYRRTLETSGGLVTDDPLSLSRAVRQGSEIVTDVVDSVRAGAVLADRPQKLQPCVLGEKPAANTTSQQDSLRADVTLFDAVVTSVMRHVADSPELLPWFGVAVRALNESINRQLSAAAVAQHMYLLSRVHHAHLNERHRIARELHDRIGEGLSVALRQLELHELVASDEPIRAAAANAMARAAITEGMRRLRTVTSDLRRHDPVANLENALTGYLGSLDADDVVFRMRVSGNEAWATHTVLDESFLILREAIRNALTHGDPTMVLIGVEMTPHDLQAWVEDDGRGFDSSKDLDAGGGSGLTSIRERTALLNGTISVSSQPGHGTRVEFLLPLPGPGDGPPA